MKAFGLLFLVFLYLFTLIGMEIFAFQVRIDSNGVPNPEEGSYADANFNNFLEGFYVVFVILVNDGWSTIFF